MPKILTIDDEEEFTNLISDYFLPRGYEVFVANQGVVALQMVTSKNPDVCLIDLKMPGIHGDEILRFIQRECPHIHCIIITASEGEGRTREKLIQMGAFACFDKPITSLKELEMKIQEAMRL